MRICKYIESTTNLFLLYYEINIKYLLSVTHTVIETLVVVWENSNNVEKLALHTVSLYSIGLVFPHINYIQALWYVCSNKAFQKAIEIFNNSKPVDAQKCQECM